MDASEKLADYRILDGFGTPLKDSRLESEYPCDPTYDVNDASLYKTVFEAVLKPYYESCTESGKLIIKRNLMYFLTTRNAPFEEILAGLQDTILPAPDDAFKYFEWLWEVLFPGEDFTLEDTEGWTVTNRDPRFRAVFRHKDFPPSLDQE